VKRRRPAIAVSPTATVVPRARPAGVRATGSGGTIPHGTARGEERHTGVCTGADHKEAHLLGAHFRDPAALRVDGIISIASRAACRSGIHSTGARRVTKAHALRQGQGKGERARDKKESCTGQKGKA